MVNDFTNCRSLLFEKRKHTLISKFVFRNGLLKFLQFPHYNADHSVMKQKKIVSVEKYFVKSIYRRKATVLKSTIERTVVWKSTLKRNQGQKIS